MLHPYHPVKAGLAILCMLLFLGCLGVLAWAVQRGSDINGPIHIAADERAVYVSLNDEILVMDQSGRLIARQQLDALAIPSHPVDLRVAADGSLLVATQRPARLYTCVTAQWQCRPIDSPLFSDVRAQLKVLPDPDSDGLLLSDTAAGQLHGLSGDGRSTWPLTEARRFRQVNDIAFDAQGRLWVADSGRHRLVVLARDDQDNWQIETELPAITDRARPGLDWPMMIAFSGAGNAWVVQPDGHGGQSDLLIYGLPHGARARVALPVDWYPTDVARHGESMLITDMKGFHIARIAVDSHDVLPFGDAAVQQVLVVAAAGKARFDYFETLAQDGMLLFGVLMIALAVWASPKGKRFSPAPRGALLAPAAAVAAGDGALHWLVRDAKTTRLLRLSQWLLSLTTLAMLGTLGYAWYSLARVLEEKGIQTPNACVTEISDLLLVLAVLTLGAFLPGYFGLRNLRHRLGSDGRYLHVQLHDGQRLVLDPGQLVYSRRMLAWRQYLFPVQTGKRQAIYAEGELETHIAPLLVRARQLGALDLLRHQLRHREPALISGLLYAAAVALVVWYTGLWRLLFPGG